MISDSECTKEESKLLVESQKVLEVARKCRAIINGFVGEIIAEGGKRENIANPIVEATQNIEDAQKEIAEAILTFENQVIRKVK